MTPSNSPLSTSRAPQFGGTRHAISDNGRTSPSISHVDGLPPFGAGDQVLLAPDGQSLHLGRGCSVESFELTRENGRVIARTAISHDLGAPIQQLVIARDGVLFGVVPEEGPADRRATQIVQISEGRTRVLRSLTARVTAVAATPTHLLVAIAGADLEPAHLLVLRRRDGKLVRRESLSSEVVALTIGRGEEVLIREGRTKRQRWVDVGRRAGACIPPGPDREPPRPDRTPPPRKPPGCGCGSTGTDAVPPDSSVPVPPPSREPQDTCIPGDNGVPDGCVVTYVQDGGWAVSVNLCEPDAEPCTVRLDWEIGSLSRTPRALVAQARDGRRVAVLDPATLRPLYEHRPLRQRVSALAAMDADAVLLLGEDNVVQLLDPTPVLPSLEPELGLTATSRVFEGQSPAVDWSNAGTAIGLHNVMIIPVMEPGQTFSGSTEGYFDLDDMRSILEGTVEYYKEVSYHNPPDVDGVDLTFRVFGRDTPTLYEGPPITLDKPFRSYWGPGWNPGAVEATVPLPGAGLVVAFSGDERLTLRCIPEVRDPLPFEIRFPAASFRVRLPTAPVTTLDFGPAVAPARVVSVDGTDRQGNAFGFTASTAALAGTTSVDISEATLENGTAVEAFADALEAMLQTQPDGALFERPAVRWHNDGEGLGMLHVTLSFASATGSDAPTVTSFDASGLGAELAPDPGSSMAARFSLPGDESTLARYLVRILSDATVEQPELEGPAGDVTGAYFELQESNFLPKVDASGGQVRIRINLSTADGRDPARIKVDSQTGLAKIGMDQAQCITGADVGFSGSGKPGIDDANHQRLVNDVFTKMVDAVLAYKTGPEGPKIDEINRYFNCEGMFPYECAFTLLHSFVVTSVERFVGVGATPAPDIGDLRGASRGVPMEDLGTRTKPVTPIGANRSKVVGSWMRFRGIDDPTTADNEETLPVEEAAATLMHELGHALLGLPDQYSGGGLRRDLRYIGGYDLMGGGAPTPHPCAYHKRVKGWLPDDAIMLLDRPAEGSLIDQEVVLVQLEGWDPSLTADAWSVIAHSLLEGMAEGTPVAAAVFLRLGGDGRHFDIVELRGKGARFSEGIDPPRVVVSNTIDFNDDTRYAQGEFDEDDIGTSMDVLKRYRRKIHLIDDSLREASVGTPDATFDFAASPAFPEVGLRVTVEEWAHGSNGTTDFDLARLRIRWTRGAAIDLGFVEAVPTWQSPDIALFRPDDYAKDGSIEFPESQSPDELERFLVPAKGEGPLLHKIGVRVWNFGDADALNVQVDLRMRRAGAGEFEDTYQTKVIDVVSPSAPEVVSFDWDVASDLDAHCCFRAQIGDRDVPTENGLALASDDTNEVNNWAQQNVFPLEAPANSPPGPVEFSYRVFNDGPFKEQVTLVPRGLGKGARVIVTPAELTIPRKRAGTFRVRVELEEALLKKTCGKDISFVLEAWRRDDDAYERWGASKYTIAPRLATKTILEGSLLPDKLSLHGVVKPDVGAGSVLLHVQLPDQPPLWQEVALGPGATFELVLPGDMPPNQEVRATARFERTFVHASSTSETLELSWKQVG